MGNDTTTTTTTTDDDDGLFGYGNEHQLLISVSRVAQLPAPQSQGDLDAAVLALAAATIVVFMAGGMWLCARQRRTTHLLLQTSAGEYAAVGFTLLFGTMHLLGVLVANGHFGSHGNIPDWLVPGDGQHACVAWLIWIQYGVGLTPWVGTIMLRLLTFAVIYDRRFHKRVHSRVQLSWMRATLATVLLAGALVICITTSAVGIQKKSGGGDDVVCALNQTGKELLIVWVCVLVACVMLLRWLARDALRHTVKHEGVMLQDMLLAGALVLVVCSVLTLLNALVWRLGRVLFSGAVLAMHAYVGMRLLHAVLLSGARRVSPSSSPVPAWREQALLDEDGGVDNNNNDDDWDRDRAPEDAITPLLLSDHRQTRRFALHSASDAYALAVGTPLARALFFNYCVSHARTFPVMVTDERKAAEQQQQQQQQQHHGKEDLNAAGFNEEPELPTQCVDLGCTYYVSCWIRCERLLRRLLCMSTSAENILQEFQDGVEQRYLQKKEFSPQLRTYLYPSDALLRELETLRGEFHGTRDSSRLVAMIVAVMKFVASTLVENVGSRYACYRDEHEQRYLEQVQQRLCWIAPPERRRRHDDDDGQVSSFSVARFFFTRLICFLFLRGRRRDRHHTVYRSMAIPDDTDGVEMMMS